MRNLGSVIPIFVAIMWSVSAAGAPNPASPNTDDCGVMYFNGDPNHAQETSRLQFSDREVAAERPTTEGTQAFSPVPVQPTFGDRFSDEGALAERWDMQSGRWAVTDGILQQSSETGDAVITARTQPGTDVIVAASILLSGDAEEGNAGVTVWSNDDGDYVRAGFDRAQAEVRVSFMWHGSEGETRFAVPKGFGWHPRHCLRVARNGGIIDVWVDGQPIGHDVVLGETLSGTGRPGLYTKGTGAQFDGVVYTRGWDESDFSVRGWKALKGAWNTSASGLVARPALGETMCVKGDPMPQYEFSAQILPSPSEDPDARVGMLAAYCDDANYLVAACDPAFKHLELSGKRDGEALLARVIPLEADASGAGQAADHGHNLRVDKLVDRVIVFVDGKQVVDDHTAWPDARVGFYTNRAGCRVLTTTFFERPIETNQ